MRKEGSEHTQHSTYSLKPHNERTHSLSFHSSPLLPGPQEQNPVVYTPKQGADDRGGRPSKLSTQHLLLLLFVCSVGGVFVVVVWVLLLLIISACSARACTVSSCNPHVTRSPSKNNNTHKKKHTCSYLWQQGIHQVGCHARCFSIQLHKALIMPTPVV